MAKKRVTKKPKKRKSVRVVSAPKKSKQATNTKAPKNFRHIRDGYKEGLTLRQERFVAAYLESFNATEAAIRAGYSKKSAATKGSQLLKVRKIQEAVQAKQKNWLDGIDISPERILKELSELAYTKYEDVYDILKGGKIRVKRFEDMPPGASGAIRELKIDYHGNVQVKLYDRKEALELLGKYRAMWVNRQEVSGADGQELVKIYLPDNARAKKKGKAK